MRLNTLATSCLVLGIVVVAGQVDAQQCQHAKSQASLTMPVSINAPAAEQKDIVDTAVGAGSFKTLVAGVKAAELVDVLKSKGPFTVFAPTDEAFAKLPKGTLETLLKPENKEKLQDILKFHVAAGKMEAKDVIRLRLLETVLGQDVEIGVSDEGVTINGAKIVKTDIQCTNGVIHVIDTVILPK